MYAAIWRVLPGPAPVKLVIALALLAAIASLLVFQVYPWIMQEFFPTPDPVLGASGSPHALTEGPA